MKSSKICSVKGCNCKVNWKRKSNGQLYYYSKCQKHRRNEAATKAYRESIWKKQGIDFTVEEYDRMFREQKGRCPICGKHQSELKKDLSVDHNHRTGKVRGLLCNPCNRTLGFYYVDEVGTEYLLNAVEYVRRYD